MNLLRGEKREAVVEVEVDLSAKERARAGSCSVGSVAPLVEDFVK